MYHSIAPNQYAHLPNGQFIKFYQPLELWQAFLYKMRIHGFHVGKAHQLMHIGMVTHVAFLFGIGIAPLFGRYAKQRHIQQVSFTGVHKIDLLRG